MTITDRAHLDTFLTAINASPGALERPNCRGWLVRRPPWPDWNLFGGAPSHRSANAGGAGGGVQSDIGEAFPAVFGTIVAFTGIGALLAFSSRCERTKERPAP